MATDFNNKSLMAKPIFVGSPAANDLPLDVRIRIETIDEIENIPYPYIGMLFYVKDEDNYYVVKSLKGGESIPGFPMSYEDNCKIDKYECFNSGTAVYKNGVVNKPKDGYNLDSWYQGQIFFAKDARDSISNNVFPGTYTLGRSSSYTPKPVCEFVKLEQARSLIDVLKHMNTYKDGSATDKLDKFDSYTYSDGHYNYEYQIDYRKQPWNKDAFKESYYELNYYCFKFDSLEDCEGISGTYELDSGYENDVPFDTIQNRVRYEFEKEIIEVKRYGVSEYYVVLKAQEEHKYRKGYEPGKNIQLGRQYLTCTTEISEVIKMPIEDVSCRLKTEGFSASSLDKIIDGIQDNTNYNTIKWVRFIPTEVINGEIPVSDIDTRKMYGMNYYIYKICTYTYMKEFNRDTETYRPTINFLNSNYLGDIIDDDLTIETSYSMTNTHISGSLPIGFDFYADDNIYSNGNGEKLTSIDYVNLENVSDASSMFKGCWNITEVNNISEWNTGNVKYMGSMFQGCTRIKSIDFSNCDLKNLSGAIGMFRGCTTIKYIGFNNCDFGKLARVEYMFDGCEALETIDLNNVVWNGGCENISYMFCDCKKLNNLTLNKLVNLGSSGGIRDISYAFYNCRSLTSLTIINWDVGNWRWCEYLNAFTGSAVTTSNITIQDCNADTTSYIKNTI
jgi:surface protein